MTIVNILYSGLGGHSSVVFPFIEADDQKKHHHVAIFYGIEDMPASYIEKCTSLGIPFYFVKKKPGMDTASHKRIKEILKDVRPGVIILHSVSLIVPVYAYTLKTKTRLITVEHQSNHLKTKKEWVWSLILMMGSHKVVYLTDLYASQMKKRLGSLYAKKKATVINNGININIFKPAETSYSLPFSIGMLSRLMATKEHMILLEAFSMLIRKNGFQDVRLKLAGDGEMKESIVQKITELQLSGSVDLPGMLPEQMCPEFLNSLTLYVHASLGETMSTAIMQAMACGKPVIASDVDGINNMITSGETGMLVPATNAFQLAEQMEALLLNKEQGKQLGQNALQYATEHFSNKAMFKKYEALFT